MKQHHIFIYALIGDPESFNGAPTVTPADIQNQINKAPAGTEELVVHIHSRGGGVDDGFAIHEMLVNSGMKIRTIIEGMCASIATVIALAGSVRQMTKNSELMIHNPYAPPGAISGDADDVQVAADRLAATELRVINFYNEKTGMKTTELDDLMKAETKMDAPTAKDNGFITEVLPELKAVAVLKDENSKDSNPNTSLMNKMMKSVSALTGKMDSYMKKVEKATGVTFEEKDNNDDDTQNRDFTLTTGQVISTDVDEDIAEGQAVTWRETGAEVADGDITLEDGTVLVIVDSKISEVKSTDEGSGHEDGDDDKNKDKKMTIKEATAKIKQLEGEKASLTSENSGLKESKKEVEKEVTTLSQKMEFIGKNIESVYKPHMADQRFATKDEDDGEEGNRFAKAKERQKTYRDAPKEATA